MNEPLDDLDWAAISQDLDGDTDALARIRRLVDRYAEVRESGAAEAPGPATFSWRHLDVRDPLGTGAFGRVYRAYDPQLRREVALKLQRADRSTQLWLAEARQLARIRHPNVIAIHGAEVADGHGGIWMDLVRGCSLEEMLAAGRPPPEAVLELALSLASALNAIHTDGLIHGDVKAGNVMVEPDGRVTLLDFGAAHEADGTSGAAAASPLSAAPEVLDRAAASDRADMYSFGVLLYRLFAGRYPFPGDSLAALRSLQQDPPDLSIVPSAYRSLLRRLLDPAPQARPCAAETEELLQQIARAPARRRQRWAVGLAMAGLSGLLLAAGGGWYASEQARRSTVQAAERSASALGFLQDVLGASGSGRVGMNASVADVLDDALRRVQAGSDLDPYVRATIEYTVGGAFLELGRESEGFDLLQQSLDRLGQLEDANPADLARVMVRLGLWHCASDVERSRALRDQLQPIAAQFEADHEARRGASKLSACVAERDGDLAAAERHLRQAIAARPGAADVSDFASEVRLGELLRDQGRITEAQQYLAGAHAGLQSLVGPDHDTTLGAGRALASVLIQQSDFTAAGALMEDILRHVEERRGVSSRSWIASANTLSILRAKQLDFAGAIALNEQVVEVASELLGADHSFTLTARSNLGVRYKDAGDLPRAATQMATTLDACRRVLGDDHQLSLTNAVNLAEVQLLRGQREAALDLAERTGLTAEQALGASHAVTATAWSVAGRAQAALGELEGATARLAAAVDVYRQNGDRSLHALETELVHLQLLAARSLLDAGAEDYLQVVDEMRERLGPDHPLTRETVALGRTQ